MRLVVTIDGELLASQAHGAGMLEHKSVIAGTVEALGNLLLRQDEMVICHGNAPQIGTMLMRSEATRHLTYELTLDGCGADTQGETGYLLQQAVQNWFGLHDVQRDVVTVITQVVVEEQASGTQTYKKGVGPFFDWELAQSHEITNGWELAMRPGFGYQRVVPVLMPKHVVEGKVIRCLVDQGVIPICAGGGGVPVRLNPANTHTGVEAVVDKAYTTVLLAREIEADAIWFITPKKDLYSILDPAVTGPTLTLDQAQLDNLIEGLRKDARIRHKLIASRDFLQGGGKSVLFVAPEELDRVTKTTPDEFITSGQVIILSNRNNGQTQYKQ